MANITIRKGQQQDVPHIYTMIRELAEFEGFLNKVTVTEQELLQSGFKANPPIYLSLVAEDTNTGKLVGYLVYYHTFSTWAGKCSYLDDVYVKREYRGFGVGRMFMKALFKAAKENGFGAAVKLIAAKENVNALRLYRKLGISNVTETEGRVLLRIDHPDHTKINIPTTNIRCHADVTPPRSHI